MNQPQTRIKAIFDALNTTPNAFAVAHQLNVPTMYAFANGTRNPGYETLVSICVAEPRISTEYLLRGEGEPLRDQQQAMALTTVEALRAFQAQMNAFVEGKIKEIAG